MTSVIKLNVGGQIFTTQRPILNILPYFRTIFSDRNKIIFDRDGIIFIDRDPKLFSYILNYLRNNNIEQLKKYYLKRVDLQQEFIFYGLNINLDNNNYITVNIGGIIFRTSRSNLEKLKFFNDLFTSGTIIDRDENNNIFLDRNPKLFSYILDFLRNRDLKQFGEYKYKEPGMIQEINFYGLK